MDKTAIKNFSIWARNKLIADITYKAGLLGVTEEGIKDALPQSTQDAEFYDIGTKEPYVIHGEEIKQRKELVVAIKRKATQLDYKDAYRNVIEEVAYTWFNRLIAIRFMEVNDYMPAHIRVLSSESKNKLEPDLVTTPFDAELEFTQAETEKIMQMKNDNQVDALFRFLFIKQCNALNVYLPKLFEKTSDYTELLLNVSVTDQDGIVYHLTHDIAEADFNITDLGEDGKPTGQVEIIGWMYQYYNTELKDDTFAKLKKNVKITKERIPSATQLFTPDWIVRYMVENTVGRVWMEHLKAIEPELDERTKAEEYGWVYYLPEAEQESEVCKKLVMIRNNYQEMHPQDILCIDPCMGSGHILVYMFDVLMDIYKSEGYSERDAVFSILENNICGLDIDRRAYQLSYFALMMKARGYNRRFFKGKEQEDNIRRLVEPKVLCIDESNEVERAHLQYYGATMNEFDRNNAMNQIYGLLDALKDAKEYGSIINVDEYNWELLEEFIASENDEGQISFLTLGLAETRQVLARLIAQGKIMSAKYDAVVTNPPYMAISSGGKKLVEYVNKHFIGGKTDMFAVFIEKCAEYAKANGFVGMITQPSLTSLVSFERLRKMLFETKQINSFLHMGRGIFGIDFGSVSFVYRNTYCEEYIGNYFKLYKRTFQYIEPEDIEKLYLYAKSGKLKKFDFENYDTQAGISMDSLTEEGEELHFLSKQDKFILVPGLPFAYAMHEKMIDCFSNGLLGDIFVTREGMATAGNDEFLRMWYEVEFDSIAFGCANSDEAKNTRRKWFPYNKGGDYRKWYGNNDYVVDWEDDGKRIRNNIDVETGRIRSHNYNGEYAFRKGLTWSSISAGDISVRWSEQGFLFDSKGAKGFASDENRMYAIQALINSTVAKRYLEFFSPTMDFKVGDIVLLPLCKEIFSSDELVSLVRENISMLKDDWDMKETSWSFVRHPLLKYGIANISDCISKFSCEQRLNREKLKANEERINEIIAEIYGLSDVIQTKVADDKLSILECSERELIITLVSYAVGCMMGRYSLIRKGLNYTYETISDTNEEKYFADVDGIVPITDEEYFSDDIVELFVEFIKGAFGEEYLEDNLSYISNVLATSSKGSTPKDRIRLYFMNEFFKNHAVDYSITGSGKRPIYWLFDSGKQNGFKALIYMHRYNADTIGNLRVDYLHRMERIYESEINRMQDTIDNSSNAREVTAATKRKEKLQKQLKECQEYDEKIGHLALSRIEIDLDDGVKVNYEKVQTANDGKKYQVLAKI